MHQGTTELASQQAAAQLCRLGPTLQPPHRRACPRPPAMMPSRWGNAPKPTPRYHDHQYRRTSGQLRQSTRRDAAESPLSPLLSALLTCAERCGVQDPLEGGQFDGCEVEGHSCSRWCAGCTLASLLLLQLLLHFGLFGGSHEGLLWSGSAASAAAAGPAPIPHAPAWCTAVRGGSSGSGGIGRRLPIAVVAHGGLLDTAAQSVVGEHGPPPWPTIESLLALMRAGVVHFEVDVFEAPSTAVAASATSARYVWLPLLFGFRAS